MRAGTIVVCLLLAAALPARAQAPASPSQRPALVLPGFRAAIAGATMDYHSPHPDTRTALLARAMRGIQAVTWETDTVPADLPADTVSFVWIMALSGSKGVQRFELSARAAGTDPAEGAPPVGARAATRFAFSTAADSLSRGFSVPGPDGSNFAFRVTWVDRYGDLFGFATLRLARAALVPGRPLVLEVRGEDAGSRAWYMTFEHRFSSHPRVAQNPVLLRGPSGAEAELHVLVDDLAGGGAATVELPGHPPVALPLGFGGNVVTVPAGPADSARGQRVVVRVRGAVALDTVLRIAPLAQRDFYVLPYSHNDIGYSDLQVNVERLQWRNIEVALDLIDRTRDYPADARYRWNVEILWPVESWLRQAAPTLRARFAAAVREGAIGLNAFLGGAQTGLATAPEMTHFFDYARRLRDRDSLPITTALISDIPGQSWGVVTALRESGIRWFALAPNNGDRIGYTIETWGDRPFWWTSQSGGDSVLMWVAGASYSLFHDAGMRQGGVEKLYATMRRLEQARSPYRQVQLPYTVNGDNGPNDPDLPDFVRDWNARYVSPHLVIATHAMMFRALESGSGGRLPSHGGDFTTYWDDGVASTAAEVALVRGASARLTQAGALWALRDRAAYPVEDFYAAWRDVALWDEHTWGAAASVDDPDAPDVRAQWAYKRAFALRADTLSRALLARAVALPARDTRARRDTAALRDAFEVYNTASWPRSGIVVVPAELSRPGDRVTGPDRRPVPSQRLSTGQLAVLVRDLPPLSGRRYFVLQGSAWNSGASAATARGAVLESSRLRVVVDSESGALASVVWKPRGAELVDRRARRGWGEYLYVRGTDSAQASGAGPSRIEIRDNGPLVSTLAVGGAAPGSRSLVREVSLVEGEDRVDVTVDVDKLAVREKEAVHFAFPFAVPEGQVRFDVASGIVRPDSDQLAGSLRNFVDLQSWADVSGDSLGVTLASPDAPLVEIGGLFAESPWMHAIPRTQTLYSYAMNNYWHTNFKAEQGGPVEFRYSLRPHGAFRPEEAVRFGAEARAPFVVAPAYGAAPSASLFTLAPAATPVVTSSVYPAADGRGWLIALYNPTPEAQAVRLVWRRDLRVALSHSDSGERPGTPLVGALELPPYGTAMLRADAVAPHRR